MARPSKTDERREQIIEATLQTIAERGISSTTLDKIADTAGMSRGHVRHFVGNREQLLIDTARRFYEVENGTPAILPAAVTDLDSASDYLFGESFTTSDSENAVVLAFVELSRSIPEIAEVLTGAYSATREKLTEFLIDAKPAASASDCEWAAEGLLAIALGNVFLGDFDPNTAHTSRSRRAAEALISAI